MVVRTTEAPCLALRGQSSPQRLPPTRRPGVRAAAAEPAVYPTHSSTTAGAGRRTRANQLPTTTDEVPPRPTTDGCADSSEVSSGLGNNAAGLRPQLPKGTKADNTSNNSGPASLWCLCLFVLAGFVPRTLTSLPDNSYNPFSLRSEAPSSIRSRRRTDTRCRSPVQPETELRIPVLPLLTTPIPVLLRMRKTPRGLHRLRKVETGPRLSHLPPRVTVAARHWRRGRTLPSRGCRRPLLTEDSSPSCAQSAR
jgi:hypothetical protein